MDGGFDRSLENFQIKGNLTVVPDSYESVGGNGSIEASGTLYVNNIWGYDPMEDLIIQNAVFADNTIYIPHSLGSSAPSVGALVLNGGISITTTANADNVSSGGSITTLGGVSVGKNLYIGGNSYFLKGADMNNWAITSVALPYNPSDAANKEYVDSVAGRVSGDFSPGELIIGLGEGEGVFGSEWLSFNSTTGELVISATSGGLFVQSYEDDSIKSFGGIDIGGKGSFHTGIDMNSTKVVNLQDPTDPQDSATKSYVDTYSGDIRGTFGTTQILVGLTENGIGTGSVIGSETLTFDISTGSLLLGTGGTLNVTNTSESSVNLSGGITMLGGIDMIGGMNVGNDIQFTATGGGMVTGLRLATDPTDATSKEYVELFAGNIKGDLSDGEVVVANGDESIRSFPSFKFDGERLTLSSTSDATALGSGGVLLLNGGGSILGSLWIGNGLDVNINRITNVDTPIEPLDAVNKEYVDQLDIFGILTSEFDYKVPIDNNVTISTEIPEIYYANDIHRAFYSYAYVFQNTDNFAVYFLMGVYSPATGWTLSQWRMGLNVDLEFGINTNTETNTGVLTYTNPALTGLASIRYKNAVLLKTTPDSLQAEFNLGASENSFSDIPGVTYLNSDLCAFTTYIYTLETSGFGSSGPRATFWMIYGILKGSIWEFHSRKVASTNSEGELDVVSFDLRNDTFGATLTYKSINPQWIRVQTFKVSKNLPLYTLYLNTGTYTDVLDDSISDPRALFEFGKDGYKTKFITLHIEIPETGQYMVYFISAFLDYDRWIMSSQFIGDNVPEISFRIRNSSGIGILQYKNELIYDAKIRYSTDVSAPVFTPLPVAKGGTGVRELLPYAVLRGNGTDPIIGTEDFIYKDYVLTLGTESSILINNTTNATGLTDGGVLTVGGGASIGGDTYLGGTLYMNAKQIKGVLDPTDPQDAVTKVYVDQLDVFGILGKDTIPLNEYEITRPLESNVPVPFTITDISYDSATVRAFYSYCFVYQDTDRYAIFSLFGLYEPGTGWTLTQFHSGQDVDVQFYISPNGNLQYTNSSLSGVSYIKFKTGIQINTQTSSPQTEYLLLANPSDFVDTGIEFNNTETLAFTSYIYTLNSNNQAAFWIVNGLLKESNEEPTWVLYSKKVKNVDDLEFRIRSDPSGKGILQYKSSTDTTIQLRTKTVVNDANFYTLTKNTFTATPIMTNATPFKPTPEPLFQFGGDGVKNKFLTFYVEVPGSNSEVPSTQTLYFLTALFDYDRWVLTTQFIGDPIPQINFTIRSEGNIGYIDYRNTNTVDANLRYFYDIVTPVFNPLSVDKGGTGSRELLPFAVLRGSGTSPIVATEDFVYRDFTLRLGNLSKILLTNSSDSSGVTNGTLISYGGIGISKSVYIGERLVVNDTDVTPNSEDIWREMAFMAGNNVMSPQPIDNLKFSNTKTRSFMGILSVYINSSSGNRYAQYTLNGLRRDTDWLLESNLLGESLIALSITTDGQIMYTSVDVQNWNFTEIKFRMMTTSA
jgi:hypothetical protein